mmetsp:Transcript_1296/g.4531  ORF Transcript_1296/g.4531 Transcript_1296/m.4531 type:complete len:461 (-) Transcript_1296:242-1624(-)
MENPEHASEKAAALPVHNKVSFFEHVAVSYATDVGKENAASNPKLTGYVSPASATDSGSEMSSMGSPVKPTSSASDEVSRLKARISHLQSALKKSTAQEASEPLKLPDKEADVQLTLPEYNVRNSPKVSKSTRKYRYFQRGDGRKPPRAEGLDSASHALDVSAEKDNDRNHDEDLSAEETLEVSKARMGMIVLRSKLEEKDACIAKQAEQLRAANMNAEEMANTVMSLEREMSSQASKLRSDAQIANRRVTELERKLEAATEATTALEAMIQKSETAIDTTTESMRSDVSALQSRLNHAQQSASLANDELAVLRKEKEEIDNAHATLKQQFGSSENRVAELEAEVEKLKFELDKQSQILKSSRVNEQAVASAKAEVAVMSKRMAQKEQDMNAKVEKYKMDCMAAQAEAQRWAQAAAASAAAAAATGAAQLSTSGSKEQKKTAKALSLFMKKHGPEAKSGA